MEILDRLADRLRDKAEEAKSEILEIGDKLVKGGVEFAENAIELIMDGIEQVADFAWDAVVAEAQAVYSGKQKFDTAVESVIQMVTAKGLSVADSTARLAVEAAFGKMREILTFSGQENGAAALTEEEQTARLNRLGAGIPVDSELEKLSSDDLRDMLEMRRLPKVDNRADAIASLKAYRDTPRAAVGAGGVSGQPASQQAGITNKPQN